MCSASVVTTANANFFKKETHKISYENIRLFSIIQRTYPRMDQKHPKMPQAERYPNDFF